MFRFLGRLIWKLIGKLFKLFFGLIVFIIVISVVVSSPSKKEKTSETTRNTSVVKNEETNAPGKVIQEPQTERRVLSINETEAKDKTETQGSTNLITERQTEKQTKKQTVQAEKEAPETEVRETEVRTDKSKETEQESSGQQRTTQTTEDQETSIPNEQAFAKVKRGDSGDSVKEAQERLIALGFMVSTPDGKFGPKTEQAVIDFQNAAGIEPSGVIDQATYTKLSSEQAPVKETDAPTLALTRNNTTRMYATANVNVRSGPSADTNRLGTLSQGETVRAGKSENGWTPIIYASGIGYVSSNYLSSSAPVLALTPVSNGESTQETRAIQQPETQNNQVQSSEPEVWVPQSGGKFHFKKTCSGMKNPVGMSLAEAKARDIMACSKCAKGW